jgi:hypothetical protein
MSIGTRIGKRSHACVMHTWACVRTCVGRVATVAGGVGTGLCDPVFCLCASERDRTAASRPRARQVYWRPVRGPAAPGNTHTHTHTCTHTCTHTHTHTCTHTHMHAHTHSLTHTRACALQACIAGVGVAVAGRSRADVGRRLCWPPLADAAGPFSLWLRRRSALGHPRHSLSSVVLSQRAPQSVCSVPSRHARGQSRTQMHRQRERERRVHMHTQRWRERRRRVPLQREKKSPVHVHTPTWRERRRERRAHAGCLADRARCVVCGAGVRLGA